MFIEIYQCYIKTILNVSSIYNICVNKNNDFFEILFVTKKYTFVEKYLSIDEANARYDQIKSILRTA